jgi:hypothetical protein
MASKSRPNARSEPKSFARRKIERCGMPALPGLVGVRLTAKRIDLAVLSIGSLGKMR